MTKETMLKLIAEKGYIVSYAAQLNFSTYDIVTSIPPKGDICIIGYSCYWIDMA